MSYITQKQIDNILNSKLPSTAALLKGAICSRCGQLRVTDKYCTYCAKRRAIKTKYRREEERLGVVRKADLDYTYERLFEERKLKPGQMREVQYRTLLSLFNELERVLELSHNGTVSIANYNQPKAAHLVRVLKKLRAGWAKPMSQYRYRHQEEVAELVGGDFGLSAI